MPEILAGLWKVVKKLWYGVQVPACKKFVLSYDRNRQIVMRYEYVYYRQPLVRAALTFALRAGMAKGLELLVRGRVLQKRCDMVWTAEQSAAVL